MKTSISTIIFILLLSFAFLLLTYCISLNEESKWITLDTPWFSNSFAFAIASGSFASLLVVLACEIQKYYSIKRQTENYIFSQLFALYTQVIIIHYNTKRQLNDTNTPVPENLISEIAYRGELTLNNLISIDFYTFCKYNKLKSELVKYKGQEGKFIRSFLHNSIFFKIAINDDKIAFLKQGSNDIVTSSSPKTHLVLQRLFDDSSVIRNSIETSLDVINNECKKRYHWDELHKSVISGEEIFVSEDLDSFLKTSCKIKN